MDWKEFKKPEKVQIKGKDATVEVVTEIVSKQYWSPDCEYRMLVTPYGYRASFNFKDSEAYIITHKNQSVVKQFCENHLSDIKAKL